MTTIEEFVATATAQVAQVPGVEEFELKLGLNHKGVVAQFNDIIMGHVTMVISVPQKEDQEKTTKKKKAAEQKAAE